MFVVRGMVKLLDPTCMQRIELVINSFQLTSLCHDSVYLFISFLKSFFNRDVGMVVPDCWVATINHPPSTHVRMPAHAH